MKSFQLTGLREMALYDTPDPEIQQPTDVLIKLGALGVCGSDIHYYCSGRIGCQVVEYPFTVGHECAGTVVAVGSEVTRVRVGNRIAIEPAMTCGQCDQCQADRENTCRQIKFLGCPGQAAGSLSEYLIMPQQNCFPIAEELSLAAATISEPLAIGIYAVQQAGLRRGARIGILGLGPIGRAVLLPAMQESCQASYGTDKIDARCAAAAGAGMTWVGNPLRRDVVSAVLEHEPLGLDTVFECCGQQEALDQAIELLRPGGTLMIVGIPEAERISFDPDKIRRKEITIVNVRRQRGCVETALDLIGKHQSYVDSLITHRFSFADAKAAFDLVADYRDGVVKAVVEFD
ncbi:MAG: zinc-dependent alcohol dehydrogenase [Pirellulaceae bacterium]